MTAGRPKLPPRRQIILRIDEGKLSELYALRPDLLDPAGATKYGAINKYFLSLLVRDLEGVKTRIRVQAEEKKRA